MHACRLSCFSHVHATLWNVCGLPGLPALSGRVFTTSVTWEALYNIHTLYFMNIFYFIHLNIHTNILFPYKIIFFMHNSYITYIEIINLQT